MHVFGHATRLIRKTPGFSLLVILILAIGIGVNTAVFTLINAVLLRPLPYHDSSSLVSVSTLDRSDGATNGCLSYPHLRLLAGEARSFSDIAAFTNETFALSTGGEVSESPAARVSWNFFELLGVKPVVGRLFGAAESDAGAKPVAIISTEFWVKHFHRNPNVVGESITLDSKPYTIVGVLPASFQFGLLGNDIEVWIPRYDELNLASAQQIQGGTCYLDGVARITPGISLTEARAEMKVLDQRYIRDFARMGDADPNRPLDIQPLKARLIGNYHSVFLMLAVAVVLVILIACANAAGLLLTHGLKRRREVAIRIALGASQPQLVMQFLTESVMLALLGGIAGVLLSLAATHAIVGLGGESLPRMSELPQGVDMSLLAFAFALSVVTGIACGLAPAVQSSNTDVNASLREEGRGTAGARSRNLLRDALVAGQIAVSLILLVGAGLLVRSFVHLSTQPPGFNPHGVLTMNVSLPPSRYTKPDQMSRFFDQFVERVEAIKGVKAAAVSSALPLNVARLTPMLVEGQPRVALPQRPIIIVQTFTSSYLRVMQMPLKEGRFLNRFDRADSQSVALVNESFAKEFFPGQSAIGKHIWIGRRTVPAEIVGVLGDIKNVGLSVDPQPEVDLPFAQLPWGRMNLLIRTAGDPRSFTAAVQRELAQLDRELPVTQVQTIDELLANASMQPRTLMLLLVTFASFASVLAIVGLYGSINYSVAQRTQEMGVRLALGATQNDVVRLVLQHGAAVTCAGIAVGLICSLLLTTAMQKLVYRISTRDPLTFCLIPVLFLGAAVLASYLPARRATRVNVLEALRD